MTTPHIHMISIYLYIYIYARENSASTKTAYPQLAAMCKGCCPPDLGRHLHPATPCLDAYSSTGQRSCLIAARFFILDSYFSPLASNKLDGHRPLDFAQMAIVVEQRLHVAGIPRQRLQKAILKSYQTFYTPQCTSIKSLMISIRWYLASLKG